MKTRKIIIAAMAAVLAFTPTAGYTFNNSPEIQNLAAAEELVTEALPILKIWAGNTLSVTE